MKTEISRLFTIVLLSFAFCLPTQAAVLAEYTFAGSLFTSTDTEANSTAQNITKGSALNANSTFDAGVGNLLPSFKFDAQNISGSQNVDKYLEFVVSPNLANWRLDLNPGTITFDMLVGNLNASKTSIWAVRSSLDSFGANIASASVTTTTTFAPVSVALPGTGYDSLSSVTFRIYAWNANNVDVWMDNITLNGVVVVPEPMNMALAGFGICFAALGIGRKIYIRSQA